MIGAAQDAFTMFGRVVALAREQQALPVAGSTTTTLSPLSPWAKKRHLATIAYAEGVFGERGNDAPVTELEAWRVAPVKKARSILLAILGAAPLVAIRSVDGVDTTLTGKEAPTWLYRSDTGISPEQRMFGLVSDLMLREASVLAVKRGTPAVDAVRGQILDAVHVPYDWWDVEDDGTFVWVDADEKRQPAHPDEFVWIPGPSAGLLVEARSELRQWLNMSRNISTRLNSPLPGIIIEDEDSGDLDDNEIAAMVTAIAKARRSPDGGVMYLPKGFKATPVSPNDDSALFIEARNATRIDIANHLAFPVALLDGSPATASLTYSTGEGKRSEFDDLSLPYWTTPITAALSQDHVVPRGTRIRFDFTARYAPVNAPTGAAVQD